MAAAAKSAEPVEDNDVETVDDGLPAAVTHQIRRHAMYAAAGGLIPVPLLEIVTSGTIQIRLVAKLCDIYGVSFSENAVKAALGSLIGSILPAGAIGVSAFALIRSVPVVGPLLSLATMPALAGAATWAVGRVFAWHFANGGTLENFDAEGSKEQFKAEFEAGKRRASSSD
jgi:uncharacterized protein (DUF697 family)